MRTILSIMLLTGVLTTLSTPSTATPILAADYSGAGTELNYDFATGWEFTVTQNILVTMLGVYDLFTPGLADAHNVGIFRKSDSSLVVSATIASGTGTFFAPGSFAGTRLVNVSPTLLLSGTAYYLLADNWFNDTYAFGTSSVTFAPEIQWNGFVDADFNDIAAPPLFLGGEPGNVGGNFSYTLAAVPLPATTVLIGFGLLGVMRRRPAQLN